MTSTSTPKTRTPTSPFPPETRRTAWPLSLLIGWSMQVVIRLLLARAQGAPSVFPDEGGYLLAARWLAGGPAADLSGNTFYQGGYPLLIAPVWWLSRDPATCYRLVLGVNALVAAGIFPLGHAALRRLRLTRRQAYALAFAAALSPAAVVYGEFALTDAILPTVLLAWLLALHTFLRRPAVLAGAAASLAASYAYTTHARGVVILAVHVTVLLAVLLGGGVVARRPAAVALLVTVAGTGAGRALNDALRAALYPGGVRDLGGILASRLTGAGGPGWTVFGAAGQLWYLIVSTWGLAGLGMAATVTALVRRRTAPPSRIMAGTLLAATLGIALASSAALPDEHRVGNLAYGRYLACLAVAYALIGLAVLTRRRSVLVHAAAAAVGVTGAALAVGVHAGDRLRTYQFIAFDFPETSFLTWDWSSLRLVTATFAALALMAVLAVCSAAPRPMVVIAVGLAAINLVALAVTCKPWTPVRGPGFDLGPPGGGVAVDQGVDWRVWIRQEYQVWWTPLTFFDESREAAPPGACLVIVAVPAGAAPENSWPGHPAGWRVMTARPAPPPWVAWRNLSCHRPVT